MAKKTSYGGIYRPFDSFLLNRDIYDVPQAQFDAKVEELTTLLDLKELLHVPVRKLSLGERMKCEIAASLLHSPEILFLDEPTIGLDVVSQVRIREFLREYNEKTGITALLTSHYMADIEALCKRVIIINEGRAIFDGQLQDLADSIAHRRRIRLTLSETPSHNTLMRHSDNFGADIETEGAQVSLNVPQGEVPQRVGQLLQQFQIEDLTVEDVEIESVIRELFTRNAGTQK